MKIQMFCFFHAPRFFNVKLILALKRRQKRWVEMGKGWYQQDISVVLIVVMCVFLLCQTPTFIDHVLWTVVDEKARRCGYWHYYYTAISDALALLNSSVNFVIYVLTSRNFRHGLIIHQSFAAASRSADYIGMQRSRAVLPVGGGASHIQKVTIFTGSNNTNQNTAATLRLSDQNLTTTNTNNAGCVIRNNQFLSVDVCHVR